MALSAAPFALESRTGDSNITVSAWRFIATAFFKAFIDSSWSDLSTIFTPLQPALSILSVSHCTVDGVGPLWSTTIAQMPFD